MTRSNTRFGSLYAQQRGDTILSFLVSVMLSSVILSAAISGFSDNAHHLTDHQMMIETNDIARFSADLIQAELRMIGAGVPFGQGNFQIGGAGLGTSPLPILTTAGATFINFRLNQRGKSAIVTTAYTPAAASLVISVNSTAAFANGDTIYLSDQSVGGSNGMRATVTSKTAGTLTISAGYTAPAGASFAVGSTVEPVTLIGYDCSNASTGISRSSEFGPVTIAPRTTCTFSYRDAAGTALPVPMTEATIRDQLTSIQVTLTATSSKPLIDGTTYVATARHTIALRNIIYGR